MTALFALEAQCQHDDLGRADDLEERGIPGSAERDDQLPLGRVAGRIAEVEGRDRQAVLRRRPDGANGRLGAVKVFGHVCLVEQEVEESLQAWSRRSWLAVNWHPGSTSLQSMHANREYGALPPVPLLGLHDGTAVPLFAP
ncbi:hypothetical protein RA210_U80139 [Rubrivivax sp. A210]|nr:hypothetical protein RA210_U80139 [Rubrivivax sp. A210]